MATNGNSPAAKPDRPAGKKKPVKDDTVVKVAGVVIAGGIFWSLFKSYSSRKNRALVHVEDHTLKKAIPKKGEHSHVAEFGHKTLDGKTIKVYKGDTLWGIAKKYNVTVEDLMAKNGIKNGDNISVGELIAIPK